MTAEENEIETQEPARISRFNRLRSPTALIFVGFGLFAIGVSADINVDFSSSLDAVNLQSNDTPVDTSFTFQLGTFSETPTAANVGDWVNLWQTAPNSNTDLSGSSVLYTQDPPDPGFEFLTPNTGASNNFAGAITLNSNASPFQEGARGYIWGFNTQDEGQTGEWILLTNPAWLFPEVEPGLQPEGENWQVSDVGTVVVGGIGAVNPSHGSLDDDPHLRTGSVFITPPVPEPSALVLLAGSAGLLVLRRRR